MSDAPEGTPHPRGIRSYVLRTGRCTTAQARALAQLGPRFILPYDEGCGDLAASALAAARTAGHECRRVVLEIGFGMGHATAHMAAHMPDTLIIGCEVHTPGVGALLRLMDERGLGNIRIVQHDAVQVLQHMCAPGTLAGIAIFFPDPWPKKRHHKRRLIQPAFAQLAATRLAPGGWLHCATDWQPYAEHMLEVLAAEPLLQNTAATPDGYAPRPDWRPETKFEQRGLRLGHGVWDVAFARRAE